MDESRLEINKKIAEELEQRVAELKQMHKNMQRVCQLNQSSEQQLEECGERVNKSEKNGIATKQQNRYTHWALTRILYIPCIIWENQRILNLNWFIPHERAEGRHQ